MLIALQDCLQIELEMRIGKEPTSKIPTCGGNVINREEQKFFLTPAGCFMEENEFLGKFNIQFKQI